MYLWNVGQYKAFWLGLKKILRGAKLQCRLHLNLRRRPSRPLCNGPVNNIFCAAIRGCNLGSLRALMPSPANFFIKSRHWQNLYAVLAVGCTTTNTWRRLEKYFNSYLKTCRWRYSSFMDESRNFCFESSALVCLITFLVNLLTYQQLWIFLWYLFWRFSKANLTGPVWSSERHKSAGIKQQGWSNNAHYMFDWWNILERTSLPMRFDLTDWEVSDKLTKERRHIAISNWAQIQFGLKLPGQWGVEGFLSHREPIRRSSASSRSQLI